VLALGFVSVVWVCRLVLQLHVSFCRQEYLDLLHLHIQRSQVQCASPMLQASITHSEMVRGTVDDTSSVKLTSAIVQFFNATSHAIASPITAASCSERACEAPIIPSILSERGRAKCQTFITQSETTETASCNTFNTATHE
jgi:hypothetical protein